MAQDVKKYVKISDEAHKKLAEEFQESVVSEYRRNMIEGNYYKYEVVLQNINFVTYMTDDELKLSAQLAIDLLEELKEINNSGMDKKRFEQLIAKSEREEKNEVWQVMSIWNEIRTDRLKELLTEIDRVQRVGGAWALLIANPLLISAICAVYAQLVDQFENEELYEISGFFFLRAIMKMHGDEVKSFDVRAEEEV